MKPSREQFFFANNWPFRIWVSLASAISLVLAVRVCEPSVAALHDWGYVLRLVVACALALIVGFIASLPTAWIFLGPLCYQQAQFNGAPFRVGDHVQILVGIHSGRVVRIYELWESRCEVRVELGESERNDVTDVFSETQICRIPRE